MVWLLWCLTLSCGLGHWNLQKLLLCWYFGFEGEGSRVQGLTADFFQISQDRRLATALKRTGLRAL